MSPLVSVLVPCHNARPWLAECLESLAAQTWRPLEVIVVDDGSKDGSAEVAADILQRSALGKLITQPNSGAAAARKRAFEAARGEYIQYLDADDLLAPDKIARQLARLSSLPGYVASARWSRFSAGSPLPGGTPQPNWADLSPADYLTLTFDAGAMMHPAAWLVPRDVAERAGPWNTRLTLDDDGDYFSRVVAASRGVAFCPEAMSYYRSNLGSSLSARRDRSSWSSAFEVCRSSTRALLSLEDSPRTRRACARYWLRLAFAAYPEGGELVNQAVGQARSLDPAARVEHGGPRFQFLARFLGWRLAKRLQRRTNQT